MRQEKIKVIVCWLLVAICMGIIFWLSSRTADESSAQSGALLDWLIAHFGDNFFTTFIVRKLAHLLEFTGLCVLFNLALLQSTGKTKSVLSLIFTSAYAVTDELHQLFVVGRSCELRDWAIDTLGALLGTICFILLYQIAIKLFKKKNTIDT